MRTHFYFYTCQKCNQTFDQKSDLDIHIDVHINNQS